MNGRRAIAGLCMLCALLASAFAAQSASAAGTTAVTCAKTGAQQVGGATFNTAHCLPGEVSGEWKHYQIAQDTTTEVTGQAGSATSKLKATIAGVATTLTSTSLTVTGTIENKKDPDGEHFAHGTGTVVFSGVTVSPFTKCFVYTDDGTGTPGAQGVIDTEKLTATTTGHGHAVKISPVAGDVLAKYWILDQNKVGTGGECTIHGTYTVTGSVIGTPEGATLSFTHTGVTTQGTLKETSSTGGTVKAGFEGSQTLEGRAGGGGYNPLSVTTF